MSNEKIEVYCDSCGASFSVFHSMDEPYYVRYCSFCGEELLEEEYYFREEWKDDE